MISYADEPDDSLEQRTRPGASKPQVRCPGCGTFAAVFAVVMTGEGWRCDGCVSDKNRKA